MAALDVSSCRPDLTESFVNLIAIAVSDAADADRGGVFSSGLSCTRASWSSRFPTKWARALIAVDPDDLVIGATRAARQALGISQACLQKSLPAAEVMSTSRKVTENLATAERGVLQRALARADGNVTAAAEALGMSRATFYRKLQRLDLHRTH